MAWTQEEEHKHLKSPYTKYSVGLTYTVWIDVEAKDQDEALDLACNSNYSIDVKAKQVSEGGVTRSGVRASALIHIP